MSISVPTITFSDLSIVENDTDRFIANFNEKGVRLDQYSVQLTALAQAIGQALTDAQGIADNAGTAAANIATNAVLTTLQDLVNEVESKVAGFHDLYLLPKPTDPSVDDDGDPLQVGAFYFNLSSLRLRIYNGTNWQDGAAVATSVTLSQISDLAASEDEVNRLSGVTSPIQQQLNAIASNTTEKLTTISSTGGILTIDASLGTVFEHTLTENTTLTVTNVPNNGTAYGFTLKVKQDAASSGFVLGYAAPTGWSKATAPELTATANAVDIFVLLTLDAGASWHGFTAGQGIA